MSKIKIETGHDFFRDRQILLNLLGFKQSATFLYSIYRGCILLVVTLVTLLAIYAAVRVPDKKLIIQILHYCLLSCHAIWGLATRILTHRSLNQTKQIFQAGIFSYGEEEADEEELRIWDNILPEISTKFNFFLILCLSGIVSNQLIHPLSQYFSVTEEDYITEEDWMNPYLPHFLYLPFNTRTTLGYIAAHLLDTIGYSCLYMTTLSMAYIYISCEVHVKTHLQVLSHSLKNIKSRAFVKYRKNGIKRELAEMNEDELFKNALFQSCLYSCLNSNIQHHQALLRLMKQVQPFIGSTVFVFFLVSAMIYACELYLIFQSPRMNLMINYVLTFCAETTYAYQICVFGEEVIEESERVFESLYSIPWFKCGKGFNKSLQVMMSNTLKPIHFKALFLGTTPSVNTFGSLLTTMYKLVNVARQSDELL